MTVILDPDKGGIITSTYGGSAALPAYVEPLRFLGSARQLTATTLSTSVQLTVGTYGLRLYARFADIRFAVGGPSVLAYGTASHWLPKGSEVSFRLNNGDTHLAVIRSHLETADGVLEVMELQTS